MSAVVQILTNYFIENDGDPLDHDDQGDDVLMVQSGATVLPVGELAEGWSIGEAAAMALGYHNAIIRQQNVVEYPDGTSYDSPTLGLTYSHVGGE